jgi:hypothetical protein
MLRKILFAALVTCIVALGFDIRGLGDAGATEVAEETSGAGGARGAESGREQAGATSCAQYYPNGWRAVRGEERTQPNQTIKPPRGKPFADATYKTCVVRITDHASDRLKGFARVDYSRRQSFNADNTQVVVTAGDGSWHLYDVVTYRYLKQLPGVGGDAEPNWHPTDPNLLYFFPPFGIGMQIREMNVKTGQSRTVADLASRIRAIWPTANAAWTKSEGSPSTDGRYWALQVDDAQWKGLGMLTYDLQNDQVLASYDFKAHGKDRPDHLSMSPSGAYVVVSYDNGPSSYNRDLTGKRQIAAKGEHSDLAIDGNGDDVYVSIDYESNDGQVYFYNLRTGKRTNLFPSYLSHTATAMHFSGRAFKKRGWVLISTYSHRGSWQWLHEKVFAVQLRANPVILNLAHHHSIFAKHPNFGGYFTEPHATVNRDFTRIMFNSNWDVKSPLDIDAYMVELPSDTIPLN